MSFTEDLSNIECPYCEKEFENSEDLYDKKGSAFDYICPHCKNEFECIVVVDYTYSTYKKEN